MEHGKQQEQGLSRVALIYGLTWCTVLFMTFKQGTQIMKTKTSTNKEGVRKTQHLAQVELDMVVLT